MSTLLHRGHLLQQYGVDMHVKIESHKLRWIQQNQEALWAEQYQGSKMLSKQEKIMLVMYIYVVPFNFMPNLFTNECKFHPNSIDVNCTSNNRKCGA